MSFFELLKLVRVFGDYLWVEYLWHIRIMPLTNRNGMSTQAAVRNSGARAVGDQDSTTTEVAFVEVLHDVVYGVERVCRGVEADLPLRREDHQLGEVGIGADEVP